jgi:hypothetical protein
MHAGVAPLYLPSCGLFNFKVQDVSIQSDYKNVNGIHVLWLDKYKKQVNMEKII